METKNYRSFRYALYLSCIIVWVITSCRKHDSVGGDTPGQVVIRVNGASYGSERLGVGNLKKANTFHNKEKDVQELIVPLSKDISIVATLTPVHNDKVGSGYNALNKSSEVVTESELQPNTVYRVVVYNPDGSYKLHEDFTYGDDATVSGLDDQVTYTFVAYSVNTTDVSDLPILNTAQNLNQASIEVTNAREFLMYDERSLKVNYNQANHLSLLLDHMFSQITTTVSINAIAYGRGARIKSIDAPTIDSERASAVLKLSDGSITYGSLTAGKVLTGDAIDVNGVQTYSFDPLNIISADVTNAIMSFPSFTISTGSTVGAIIDVNNVNFELPNLKIKPGYRYSLNLNIVMPCVERVEPTALFDEDWPSVQDGYVHESPPMEFESSDYGVEVNIFRLDQSFQLIVNGDPIFVREAGFEYFGPLGGDADDVRFLADDGRYYFETYDYSIYDLIGDPVSNNPIVKLVIDVNGNVTMFGSRVSYGATVIWEGESHVYGLEPMYLTNGNGFNQVTWNSVGNNIVILQQSETGPTNISFNVAGYKKVVCQ